MAASIPEGYVTDPGFDPAEDHVGPFYYRQSGDAWDCLFIPGQQNCNVNGLVHGGILMTFADFSLCLAATDHYNGESCTTISFSADFSAAASKDEAVYCTPRITRKTGSLVFVTGEMRNDDTVLMTFSAVVKRLRDA